MIHDFSQVAGNQTANLLHQTNHFKNEKYEFSLKMSIKNMKF